VEQPRAMSTAMALAKAFGVAMSRGRIFFLSSSMTFMPACLASLMRSANTAGMVPLPGRPRPRASVRQFMELAVNMPEQEPAPGQAQPSSSTSSDAVMVPAFTLPTPSKTLIRSTGFPLSEPASMGPPDTTMHGTLSRSAAMSMPGTTLSQLGMKTRASKAWPMATSSMESAMISREGRE